MSSYGAARLHFTNIMQMGCPPLEPQPPKVNGPGLLLPVVLTLRFLLGYLRLWGGLRRIHLGGRRRRAGGDGGDRDHLVPLGGPPEDDPLGDPAQDADILHLQAYDLGLGGDYHHLLDVLNDLGSGQRARLAVDVERAHALIPTLVLGKGPEGGQLSIALLAEEEQPGLWNHHLHGHHLVGALKPDAPDTPRQTGMDRHIFSAESGSHALLGDHQDLLSGAGPGHPHHLVARLEEDGDEPSSCGGPEGRQGHSLHQPP